MSVPLALRGKGLWTDSSMDRISASGADDTGSNPVPFTTIKVTTSWESKDISIQERKR